MAARSGWESLRARLAREQTILVSLIVAYIATGKFGLSFSFADLHPVSTLVWPPSGIALAAFLVLGYRVWPAVFGAAAVLYVTTIGLVPAAVALAGGNTLEGLLAAYLVNRYAGGRHALQSPRDSLRFAGAVILASATVGATLNTLVLVTTDLTYWTDYGSTWVTFSVGSVVGMLLVAPLIVLHSQGSTIRWRARRTLETAVLFVVVVAVGLATFYRVPVDLRGLPNELLVVPVMLWAALRLGRRVSAAALLVFGALAIVGTLHGYGPFVRAVPFDSLLVVQTFMGMTAVMTLSLAALAADYEVAEAQLRELVVTDPLTGLPNYRRLLDVLGMEMARSDRQHRPFAVVFFDMDGLKRINDEHGHLIGSRAVCRFAETLQAACRATDTPARYGGDEFVAVLSDTDEDGAALVVRRIAERLSQDKDQPLLSVSAGIAVYPRDGGTPTTLLSAADRALYSVKAEKGNLRRRSVVGIREWSNAR